MNLNNAISKTLMLLIASTALAACGDDKDKSNANDNKKPAPDQTQEIPKLTELADVAAKQGQPAASKALSVDNPAAKIAEGVDKAALAKAKAVTVALKDQVIQLGDVRVNDPAKGIQLKDDTLFKLVIGLGKSSVHGTPSNEVRYVYNTPYASLNMRYRETVMKPATFGFFRATDIKGLFTTPDQIAKLQKAGGKATFEGLAFFQKAPGVIGDGKLEYNIDLAKLEGSGKISGLEGVRDFAVGEDRKGTRGEVGIWLPDVKEIQLGAVSFAKPTEISFMGGKFNGGEGKVKFEGQTDDKIGYVVGAVGPELNSIAGAVSTVGHGGGKDAIVPFFGMRTDVK